MTLPEANKDLRLLAQLSEDPAILFIGQAYQRLGRKSDIFLNQVMEKYKIVSENPSFNVLLEIAETDKDAVRTWLHLLLENISTPTNFEQVIDFPWSHVYTSSIDSSLVRIFRKEEREIQPILSEAFKIVNPRSRSILNQTFLYGQIQYADAERRTPLTLLEFSKRKAVAAQLLNRLPYDIATPKGVLVIEAWDPQYDWLTSSELYSVLSKFPSGHVHLFSSNEQLEADLFIKDLVLEGKLILHREQLSSWISRWKISGALDTSRLMQEGEGTWIFLGKNRVRVPKSIKSSVNRNAILLTKELFDEHHSLHQDDQVTAFREFISSSPTVPNWGGYTKGFAFRRDFIDSLLRLITDNVFIAPDKPIILHGQASSGKTIGLGQLAYELVFSESVSLAYLFIERNYRRLDENALRNIDEFCLWAEENGAQKTVIIYDGMLNYDFYYGLLSNFISRGRKVTLVGSTYLQTDIAERNFVEVPIQLTVSEQTRFESYIKAVIADKPAIGTIIRSKGENNFLSILYHYLPGAKTTISDLIRQEAKFYSNQIRDSTAPRIVDQNNLILRDLLENLGFTASETDHETLDNSLEIGGENERAVTQFVNLVMVIGKQGYAIPFELLLRTIGLSYINSDVITSIPNSDLIRWKEEHNGNINVGPRTQLEAMIYSNSLGGAPTEVNFIKSLLSEVRDSSASLQEDPEIEFATSLIQHLKSSENRFRPYIFQFAEILSQLRKSRQAVHPRLMLQEASLFQEAVKDKIQLPPGISHVEVLEEAERIIHDALVLEGPSKSPTVTFLKVELASILGSKATQNKNERNYSEARALYEEARDAIKSFSFSSKNYHALDILFWTIRDQAEMTTDPIAKAKLYAEALHLIQFGDEEGFGAFNTDFLKRKMEIYDTFGEIELTEETFKELLRIGSKAGYLLKAKSILGKLEISGQANLGDQDILRVANAVNYLNSNINEIKYDSQCMYFLLKLWWLSKTRHGFYSAERTTIKLNTQQWLKLEQMTKYLVQTSEAYISPTVKYLMAIAQFHNNDQIGCFETFKELSEETDNSLIGARRVKKYYVASLQDGRPRLYQGVIDSPLSQRQSSAWVSVEGLSRRIKCFYSDFHRDFRDGQAIEFSIAFNFIGPVAIPVKPF
ncbi:hypothetical protein ACWKW6_12300 [Dyadobacter jiangsuensis]